MRQFYGQYHRGHPPRLSGWDYAVRAPYFVSFKVSGRRPLVGHIAAGNVRKSRAGPLVRAVWERLPERFPRVARVWPSTRW